MISGVQILSENDPSSFGYGGQAQKPKTKSPQAYF
jgi:hypothetical protein